MLAEGERWVRSKDRAYAVTCHDAVPKGFSADRRLPSKVEKPLDLTVSVGRVGKSSFAAVMLAFEGTLPAGLGDKVLLNGVRPTGFSEVKPTDWMGGVRKVKTSCRLDFPLSAAKDGDNVIRIAMLAGGVPLRTCELLLGADK